MKNDIVRLGDIVLFNPHETMKKGKLAKKIDMSVLQPFTRDVPSFEILEYKGGSKFRNGDTIMARITPCLENGKTAKVNILEDDEVGFGSTEYIVFRAIDGITDADYVYYLVCSPIVREPAVKSMVGSSGRQRVQTDVLKNLKISIPDLKTQSRITAVLSALDDKIALNTAINENLEQQAQAIFKSWFVDFEPFGGVMPAEWKEATLNDVCKKITDGSHYSPKDNPSANIPMLSVKDMLSYGFNFQSCKHIDENEFQKMVVNDCVPLKDDILVAKDGSYLKEIFICNCKQRIAILSSIAIFRPNTEIIIPEILLALLKSPAVLQEVKDNYVSGSVLPRIVLKDFKKLRLILPSMKVQEQVAPMLHNIRLQIDINCEENQRLSALRDTLLPKLMNGEIEV